MKRWKLIRCMLASVGYTTMESVEGVTITDIDSEGYIYYTDADGNHLKALYNSTTPIVVDSDTSTIYIPGTVWVGGLSAYTYTFDITNEDNLDVTSEITFTSNDETLAITGGTNGRLLTAISSGTTTWDLVHADIATHPTASGITNVIVGQINSELAPSGGTLDPDGNGVYLITADSVSTGDLYYLSTGITIQNQDTDSVTTSTASLRYTIDGGSATELSIPVTGLARGIDSNVVVYDVNAISYNTNYTGVTYTAHYVGAQSLIPFASVYYLGGLSAWTATSDNINNDNGTDVSSYIIVTSNDSAVVTTGGTDGRSLTAVAEGTTTINEVHYDYDAIYNTGASATTNIVVGQINTGIYCSGGTLGTLDTYAFQITASTNYYLETGVTLYNQDSDSIVHGTTADIYFTKDYGSGVSGAYAYNMAFFVDVTGTTSLVIFDINARTAGGYTGQTYTVTVV